MNILFVGYQNNLNQTVVDLLSSQAGFNVQKCPPDQLESRVEKYRKLLFDILLVDLTAYPLKPTQMVKKLKTLELCRFLIAIHIYSSSHLIKPILEAGADGYLPSATTETDMLTAINKISNGKSYPEI